MSNSRMPTWYSLIVLGAGRIPGLFVRPRSSPACIRSGWSTGSAEVRAHDRQYADLFRSEPTVESERHPTTHSALCRSIVGQALTPFQAGHCFAVSAVV